MTSKAGNEFGRLDALLGSGESAGDLGHDSGGKTNACEKYGDGYPRTERMSAT